MGVRRRWRDPMGNFGTGLLIALCLILIVFLAMGRCEAQFLGYTSPQSVEKILASATSCTGSAQQFSIPQLGQNTHDLTISTLGGITSLNMQMIAQDVQGNQFAISDTQWGATLGGGTGHLYGTGLYPILFAQVTCSPGSASFTLNYSGTSAMTAAPFGATLQTQIAKVLLTGAPAGSSTSKALTPPFGGTGGTLVFTYTGAGPAGSSLVLTCAGGSTVTFYFFTYSLNTANGVGQGFNVPNVTCPSLTVAYQAGGASASTYTLEYDFASPGNAPVGFQYTHIPNTTATEVKASAGLLHTVNINTANAAAGTVSLFDLPSASCTGTPATNTVAVITTPASVNGLPPYVYDTNFQQGICIKASQTMDITVSAQ